MFLNMGLTDSFDPNTSDQHVGWEDTRAKCHLLQAEEQARERFGFFSLVFWSTSIQPSIHSSKALVLCIGLCGR